MNERDLDLNLLRVFVAVVEAGSVTAAARRLYLTQPAVSAACQRLARAVGAPLFARAGRGLALTARGERLFATARPHLDALIGAALRPGVFEARASTRTVRLGLADANEAWLLPALVGVLRAEAPEMRLVVVPIHFRSVGEAFSAGRVDLAVTVADELPAGVGRSALFTGGFTCLFDPAHAAIGRRLTLARYLAHPHVIVSYNGDLRGIVEDALGLERAVRVSVSSFYSVGAVVAGSNLLATVPALVAAHIRRELPELETRALPFRLAGTAVELLVPSARADDEAIAFVAGHVKAVARRAAASPGRRPH